MLIELHSLETMLVWKAARATSAALSYFDPIQVDGVEYRDGGLMYNNPVEQVHSEASVVFPGRSQVIISLGTGLASTRAFAATLPTITKELARIATDSERVASNFYQRDDSRAAESGQYFRFNVPEIGDKGLAESKPEDLTYLRIMTESYIDNPETGSKLTSCADKVTEGALSTFSFNPGLPEGLPCVSSAAPQSLSLEERLENLGR